jgi:hypothetical protein
MPHPCSPSNAHGAAHAVVVTPCFRKKKNFRIPRLTEKEGSHSSDQPRRSEGYEALSLWHRLTTTVLYHPSLISTILSIAA